MRLLDQVAQARAPLVIVDGSGPIAMPGPAELADAVAACPTRFVLERDAAEACRNLLANADTLHPAPLRLPSPAFWAEWTEEDGLRTGVVVQADETGRRGSMETFWERPGEQPDRAQARILFDFDRALARDADWTARFALHPRAHRLSRHLLFEVDGRWVAHFGRAGPDALLRSLEVVVSNLTPALDLALAFSILLASRGALAADAIDRSRLNRSRRASGKPVLLDHLQVRLDLAAVRSADAGGEHPAARNAARLHHVRGHLVRRADRTFWRRPHLRGAVTDRPIARRTVLVRCTSKGLNTPTRRASPEPFSAGESRTPALARHEARADRS